MAVLVQKRLAWKDVISSAENKIDAIDKIIECMAKSKEATKMYELTDEQRAWLLVKIVCAEDLHGQSILSEGYGCDRKTLLLLYIIFFNAFNNVNNNSKRDEKG